MAISGEGDVLVWNLSSMTLVVKSSLTPLFRSVASCVSSTAAAAAVAAPLVRSSSASASAAAAAPAVAVASRGAGGSSPGGGEGAGPSGASVGGAAGKLLSGVSVARAGVTVEGMPLVMLACPGAFGGALQAFALHQGLGTWVRVADGRYVLA